MERNSRYTTGNAAVDRLARMEISGNVVPQAWYKTICRETGKPYLNAIVILSDIVYWYRPVEIREEGTGAVAGYRKRFKADLLQRSYQQISEQFGISRRDAANAVIALEKLGVIQRVFRNLTVGGLTVPNVLFIALNPERLEELTFPNTEPEAGNYPEAQAGAEEETQGNAGHQGGQERAGQKVEEQEWEERNTGERNMPFCADGEGVPQKRGISPKTDRGLTYMSDIPHPNLQGGTPDMGEYTKNTYTDSNRDYLIYQQTLAGFKEQIGYEGLKQEYAGDTRLEELVDVAAEILTSPADRIRVNREERPASQVRAQFAKLTGEHMEYVLESLDRTQTCAVNIRAVMVTALYNAAGTLSCHAGNLYRYHRAQGVFEGRDA